MAVSHLTCVVRASAYSGRGAALVRSAAAFAALLALSFSPTIRADYCTDPSTTKHYYNQSSAAAACSAEVAAENILVYPLGGNFCSQGERSVRSKSIDCEPQTVPPGYPNDSAMPWLTCVNTSGQEVTMRGFTYSVVRDPNNQISTTQYFVYCPDGPPPPPMDCSKARGNPCDSATGNKYEIETDYRGQGVPSFTRSYNSLLVGSGSSELAAGWALSLNVRRISVNGAEVTLYLPDGRWEYFTCSNGTCQGKADSKLRLAYNAAGYTLTRLDGSNDRYDLNGVLQTETDAFGQLSSYGYDAQGRLQTITGPFGHTLTLGYDTSGRVGSVTDAAGRGIIYSYTAVGTTATYNLTRVNYP